MDIIIASEHGSARIKERMGMHEKDLIRILMNRRCILITKTLSDTPEQYIVVWDEIAQKPFLVIVEVFLYLRNIKTVYETWPYHSRRHGVMVMPSHINQAKEVVRTKDERNTNKGTPPNSEEGPAERRLSITITVMQRSGASVTVKRERLATISSTEFANNFGNLTSYLAWYIDNNGKGEIEIPKDSNVYLDLRRKNKQEIIESLTLQETF